MQKNKVSFITTVRNEEKRIGLLLQSLASQSEILDEIIIVDGGSSDQTVAKLKSQIPNLKKKLKNLKFKIIIKKGNRSIGRNEAIKNATGNVIVISDAGCILDKNWVKNIVEPFNDSKVESDSIGVDVVAGYYRPIIKNNFQKCLATYTCVMPDKINRKEFLPSSRSIAFKKSVWEKVRGYPENLDTCEDLIFDKKLKEAGAIFKFQKNAIVYWPQRENIFRAFEQFFNYAKGDGEAHYFRLQTPFLFARYFFGLIIIVLYFILKINQLLYLLFLLIVIYIMWSILKNYKYIKKWQAFFILPSLQITSDIAVLLGTSFGFIRSLY